MSFPFSTSDTVNRIIERLNEIGLSVEYICEAIGVSTDVFNGTKNENATLTNEQVDIIATLLKVSPEYLKFGFSVSPDLGITTEEFLDIMIDCPSNPTEHDKRVLDAAAELAKMSDNYR